MEGPAEEAAEDADAGREGRENEEEHAEEGMKKAPATRRLTVAEARRTGYGTSGDVQEKTRRPSGPDAPGSRLARSAAAG
jgi:hypothetical protein